MINLKEKKYNLTDKSRSRSQISSFCLISFVLRRKPYQKSNLFDVDIFETYKARSPTEKKIQLIKHLKFNKHDYWI